MSYTSPEILYTGTMYIPEDNIYVSFEVTEETPFNKCFACRSFRNGCSGPNLLAMGVQRACVFLQTARIFWKLKYPGKYSYQYCADQTKLSLSTVKRTLTGKIEEPEVHTLMQLNNLLVADPNGKFPCACPVVSPNPENSSALIAAARDAERLVGNDDNLKEALDTIHASYRQELNDLRIDHKESMDASVQHYERENAAKEQQIQRLRMMIDHLTEENSRKSRMIDKFMDSHFSPVPKD